MARATGARALDRRDAAVPEVVEHESEAGLGAVSRTCAAYHGGLDDGTHTGRAPWRCSSVHRSDALLHAIARHYASAALTHSSQPHA